MSWCLRMLLVCCVTTWALAACNRGNPQHAGIAPGSGSANAVSQAKEKSAMDDAPTPSRPAPPNVPPVEHKGVRYQQDMESFRFGGTQRGGYLVAIDPKTGERLWMLKVYPVTDHNEAGVETPGIYF